MTGGWIILSMPELTLKVGVRLERLGETERRNSVNARYGKNRIEFTSSLKAVERERTPILQALALTCFTPWLICWTWPQ